MNTLVKKAIAPSTQRVYSAGVRLFEDFCRSQRRSSLPASELTIRLFCTEQAGRVSYSTVSTYVSAIRMQHLQHGHQDPTVDAPLLSLLLQGIKRSTKPPRQHRQPITADILTNLKPAISALKRQAYQSRLFWAAFTLAFYGFLRVGEYTSRRRNKRSPDTLLARSITLDGSTLTIRLRRSKTSQFKLPPPIHIGATNSVTCPVKAMERFLSWRHAPSHAPLFIFQDGTFLTAQMVSSTLKSSLRVAGYNPTGYSSHSFRIGAATAASAAGLTDHQIQRLGRWTSNAFATYVRPTKESLSRSSKAMAHLS